MEHSQNPVPMDHWAQQSPIKLFRAESLYVEFPKSFLSIDYSGAPFSGKFDGVPGHKNFVLNELSPDQNPPLVKLGCVTAELVKIHLHTPSEHELEGENKGGEIHLIHQIKNPTGGSELLVLGVFFEVKAKKEKAEKEEKATSVESKFFQLWAASLKAAAQQTGLADAPDVSIDPRHLLPKTTKWYRYEGSLTSEPYREIVSWVVFTKTLGIESEDLKLLQAEAHQPEREVQAINRRFVLRNFN
ncbi:MAG: carbonic anhydrase family protein [Candidatus Saccharimonas sp.]|nr:carbonic anhydrase family protein [Planctomycetaceae bacterium]